MDEVVWVKMTVNRRLAKSHGFYLQHAKEVCLVARKGADPPGTRRGVGSDILFSERRGQSQKPEEIYQLVEELVPNGEGAAERAAARAAWAVVVVTRGRAWGWRVAGLAGSGAPGRADGEGSWEGVAVGACAGAPLRNPPTP